MATVPLHDLRGPAGRLDAMLEVPDRVNPRAAVVLAHPDPQQGGSLHSKVVYAAAKALAGIGCAVLRFNFRGVGSSEGAWDDGRGERDDFRAALDFMSARYPASELWAAGYSFGSWIATTEGVVDPRVSLLVAIAPPIGLYDFGPLKTSAKPKFIVHGEADELIPLRAVREFYAQLQEPKELVEIDRANHLFEGQTSEVGDALEDLLEDFTCRTQ